ncbi:protocadherin alpha-8-like isoform X3 [Denticeps clupeoides]|uniref:protocadherin alpha-8-like isoform X3 n=1 Tax=Denticeps clupeoides TaxID=299321 RepID=UPI0010A383A4|nr:protocadherin alpha-8-like isoform X3 [Denticeps clupeoides]
MASTRGWVLLACFHFWSVATGQTVYSVSEEVNPDTTVGNLAKDLNLDVKELVPRGFQIVAGTYRRYFYVNVKTGVLHVKERIDREGLCGHSAKCALPLEAIVNSPVHIYRFEVNVLDVNDNAPAFRTPATELNISESSSAGERFSLPRAHDPDVGSNSVRSYKLTASEHFSLDVQSIGGSVSAELVLQTPLDREKQSMIRLTLTAVDGGKPPRSGTMNIVVNVEDVNDNIAVFSKSLYKVRVAENAPPGTPVVSVHATDSDQGPNGEVVYSFINHDSDKYIEAFSINQDTGAITVVGELDYETNSAVEIRVQAKDKGYKPRAAHCKVLVEIMDVNDNVPKITMTSLVEAVKEDAPVDTTVGMITVSDEDAGKNGHVGLKLLDAAPFRIQKAYKNYYTLLVDGPLDRERVGRVTVTLIATDEGSPPLSSTSVVAVRVSDVNDNAPRFPEPVVDAYVKENSPPGVVICKLVAFDPDAGENAQLSYSLVEGPPKSFASMSAVSVDAESGEIVALQSFNHEEIKTFQFKVHARDSGVPPLSSNVTVNVFVLDENDNRPSVLAPYSDQSSVNSENIPYSAEAGYFVAKIRAVDADSGYNALLSYHISDPKGNNLFRIGTSSGEIRTKRRLSDNDLKSHPLVVMVSDHGEPSLSATVSIDVVVVENTGETQTQFKNVPSKDEILSDLNLYLLVAVVSVSVVFLLSLVSLIAVKCHASKNGFSKYSAPVITSHPDGTWSYSKSTQQYDVCFSSDTLKSDVVVFPAPFPPVDSELISINGGDTFNRTQTLPNKEKPKAPNADWRYSASLRAGMQSSVHMEESSVMQGAQGVLVQNWPTVSSAADGEGGEVSPPVGAGMDSNSWHFRYGPGGPPQHLKPGEVPPEAFIIPGSPAIISIRQGQDGGDDKSDFITFGKKEEAKKKKKKKKEKKDKKEKGRDDDE